MESQRALVSVIIPVYNVREYLVECVDSILAQTYEKLEIILIDDGSSDTSSDICDQYANKYEMITVIHQENRGLSAARNVALNIATGEYVTFVDSDDYVSKEFVEYLLKIALENDAELTMCDTYKFFDNDSIKLANERDTPKCYNAESALEDMLYRKNITSYACAKLYKRELFEEIRFPEGQLFEDLFTIYKIIDLCSNICWGSAQMYFYRQRRGSIVNSKFDERKLSVVKAGVQIEKFVKSNYPAIENAAISKIFVSAVDQYRRIPNDSRYDVEKNYLESLIYKNRRIVLWDKKNKGMVRGIAFVACINIKLLRKICRFYTFLNEKMHFQLKKPV